MATYCYTLVMDGAERDLPSADYDDEPAAIDHGRELLKEALQQATPQTAYVAVFEDEGPDDEPLGAWDWRRDAPNMVWSPAD